jgi:hypothetical protein
MRVPESGLPGLPRCMPKRAIPGRRGDVPRSRLARRARPGGFGFLVLGMPHGIVPRGGPERFTFQENREGRGGGVKASRRNQDSGRERIRSAPF